MIRWLFALLLLLGVGTISNAQEDLLPEVPSTQEQDSLIAIGIAWHDRKEYAEAIEFYKKALLKNPANTTALYELAFSHHAKGELEEALKSAMEGVRYRSRLLPQLYMVMANIYDDQKEPKQAVETYRKALALSPDFFLLHYNLAVTLAGMGKRDEASASLQQALRLNPFHPSSHLALANTWMARGLRVPALMAFTHFLILEGGTERANTAAAMVEELVGANKQASKENNVIYLNTGSSDTSEGNFHLQEATLSLLGAANIAVESVLVDSLGAYRTTLDKYVQNLQSAVRLVAGATGGNATSVSFTQQFYLPWYSEIVRLNHVEVFCHLVAANSMIPGAKSWLTEHQDQVKMFTGWMKEYRASK